MYLLISMPLDLYDGFVGKLDVLSRAYEVMNMACSVRSTVQGHLARTMKILCQTDEATVLLDLANRLYPGAAPDIAKAFDFAR